MKTTLTTTLASIAIALTAAASPSVRIDMTIATGADGVVARPSFYVESGKRAMLASGNEESELACGLTPTLLANGTVDIQTVITERKGKKTDRHTARIVAQLGKLTKVKVGELFVTVKPTRGK